MTKFGVYHGKDAAFRQRFAAGGAMDALYEAAQRALHPDKKRDDTDEMDSEGVAEGPPVRFRGQNQ